MPNIKHLNYLKVFEENATKWWSGKEFSILRSMNQLRVPFIVDNIGRPLTDNCRLLDVGCGGGLLSEPLARLGAKVTGIDPVLESINQANAHANLDPLVAKNIAYKNCNIEDLSESQDHINSYDGIIASEVLEHIEDVEGTLQSCYKLLKPNGNLFITTINQTPLSWLGVIFFGEYVLKQVPKGTHQYNMFVNVKGLRIMLERLGYQVRLVNGFMYEPISGTFHWTSTTLTHYALHAIKTPTHRIAGSTGGYVHLEQKRFMSKTANKKISKPKRPLDQDDIMKVIPYDNYLTTLNQCLHSFSDKLENIVITRASTVAIEKLKIKLDNIDEPIELRDLAQISIKGNNLIVINLSSTPQALKPTMQMLRNNESMNPQVEVNNIYLPVPRITREHRERVASDAKKLAAKSKEELRSVFSDYSSRSQANEKVRGLSKDLVRDTIENIRFDLDKRLVDVDRLLEQKLNHLLNKVT